MSNQILNACKAVLFDYDGVIADTMKDNAAAWQKAFEDSGKQITEEEYYALEGLSPVAVARTLGAKKQLSAQAIAELPGKKAAYYRQHNAFRVYPEIPAILRSLSDVGMRLALVSGASHERIREMTPQYLLDRFDVIVGGEDTEFPKPDPAPYQRALNALGVSPQSSVVIENAPLGIQAAKSAGCYCIAIKSTLSDGSLALADVILIDHSELKKLLSEVHKIR